MSQKVWLSYDLGVRGNYPELYAWLDRQGAKECGDSVAVFCYDSSSGSLKDSLRRELEPIIQDDKKARIYTIYFDHDKNHVVGAFLFGGRKAASWVGFGTVGGETDEDN